MRAASDEQRDIRAGAAPRPAGLPASAQRVRDALAAAGIDAPIVELTVAARTAQQAADALGVAVGQIAKSLIFRAGTRRRSVSKVWGLPK